MKIISTETLETTVADLVRYKIQHTAKTAEMDEAIAKLQKRYQTDLTTLTETIADLETAVEAYCASHRAELFPAKKSRETTAAIFGWRTSPPRVEPATRKLKWADIVARLQSLTWGSRYLRQADPKPDKETMLEDRSTFTPEQLTAMGIRIVQDEDCWYLDPKPETANL
jgi:phage host-nuclease inhibitor protein Gam